MGGMEFELAGIAFSKNTVEAAYVEMNIQVCR